MCHLISTNLEGVHACDRYAQCLRGSILMRHVISTDLEVVQREVDVAPFGALELRAARHGVSGAAARPAAAAAASDHPAAAERRAHLRAERLKRLLRLV